MPSTKTLLRYAEATGSRFRVRLAAASGILRRQATLSDKIVQWRALRESNPCFRRERAASWTARRRALGVGSGRGDI